MKSFFTLLLLAVGSASIAQPTLTAGTSIPTAGMSMQQYENNLFTPGSAGANQTWDFGTQSFSNVVTQVYEACNATNNCSAYPNTSIVRNTIPGGYSYYGISANVFSLLGAFNNGVSIVYSNPEELFHFPMTYGSSYVDAWSSSYVNGGYNIYQKGNDSVSADGWGTLKTPAGTFTNTLRVKRIQTYSDSIGGNPSKENSKIFTYTWYDDVHKDFLFSTSSITQGQPFIVNYSYYTSNQSLSVSGQPTTGIDWSITPNPATGKLRISLQLPAAATVSASLNSIAGQCVRSLQASSLPQGRNIMNMNTEGLPAGIYMLRINAGEACAIERITVAP